MPCHAMAALSQSAVACCTAGAAQATPSSFPSPRSSQAAERGRPPMCTVSAQRRRRGSPDVKRSAALSGAHSGASSAQPSSLHVQPLSHSCVHTVLQANAAVSAVRPSAVKSQGQPCGIAYRTLRAHWHACGQLVQWATRGVDAGVRVDPALAALRVLAQLLRDPPDLRPHERQGRAVRRCCARCHRHQRCAALSRYCTNSARWSALFNMVSRSLL